MAQLLKPGSVTVVAGGFDLISATDYPEDESSMSGSDAGALVSGVRQEWAKSFGRGQRRVSCEWNCRKKYDSWSAAMAAKASILASYPRAAGGVTESFGDVVTTIADARVTGCNIRQRGVWLHIRWTVEGGEIS